MEKRVKALLAFLFLCLAAPAVISHAQAPADPAMAPAATPAPVAPDGAAPLAVAPPITLTAEEMNAPFAASFFLTPDEITAIRLAMAGKPAEAGPMIGGDGGIAVTPIPARRVISVSGLLYRSPKDWIVWMNGQKVTPENLLPEIVDIKVDKSSAVSLKWYDIGKDAVIAITLRPHQVYDIANGVLLPGAE